MLTKMLLGMTALSVFLVSGSEAKAASINFDSLAPGSYGSSFTSNDITFFDAVSPRVGGNDQPGSFVVQNLSSNYIDQLDSFGEFLSPLNYLVVDQFIADGGLGFGGFRSISITTGKVNSSASVSIFTTANVFDGIANLDDDMISFEAFFQGELVGTDQASLLDFAQAGPQIDGTPTAIFGRDFSISNVKFDTLKIRASGGSNLPGAFIGIDNVGVRAVPEPLTVLGSVVAVGIGAAIRKRIA